MKFMIDLFDLPPAAPGKTDTSKEAAAYITVHNLTGLRRKVYDTLALHGDRGRTPDEMIAYDFGDDINPYSLRPRLTELRNAGIAVDTGERRPNRRGRNEIVYKILKQNL